MKSAVKLDPLNANAEPATIVIEGSSRREIADVLVSEVRMCSGQSNMRMTLGGDWKFEVEHRRSRDYRSGRSQRHSSQK